MSLVSEALRKAREEGRLAHARRWVPSVGLPGSGGRRGISAGFMMALTLAAAVGGAAVAWLLVPSPSPRAAQSVSPLQSTAPSPGGLAAAKRAATPDHAAPARGDLTTQAQPHAVPARPTLASAAVEAGAEMNGGDGGLKAADGTTGASERKGGPDDSASLTQPPAVGSSGKSQVRTFVLDADLGYARLHLDYLVYKPSAPFGSINGQHVTPGSTVAGFRVDELGADFVRLSDARGVVVLRVR